MSLSDNYPDIRPLWMNDYANAGVIDPRCSFARSDSTPSNVHYWSDEDHLSSENLVVQSQDLDTTWTVFPGTPAVTGGQTAPDGTTTAWVVTAQSASSAISQAQQSVSSVGATKTYTLSAYLKAGTASHTYMTLRGSGSTYGFVEIDWSDPLNLRVEKRTFSSASATVTEVGSGGWYRVALTTTTDASTSSGLVYIGPTDGTTQNANGYPVWNSSGETAIAWGVQLEERGSATAYNATTTQIHREYAATLKSVAYSGQPRFEYEPTGDREAKGLLIESSSSNLLAGSATIGGAYWNVVNATTQQNSAVAPDGTLTATTLVENSAGGAKYAYSNTYTPAASTTYTFSVFVKPNGRNFCMIYTNFGGAGQSSMFDLVTGATSNLSGSGTNQATQCGNGWWRLSVTLTTTSTTAANFQILPAIDATTIDYTGNGYSGLLCWGAQNEASSFASSYIATSGSASTRTRDQLSVATADIGFEGGPLTLVADSTTETDTLNPVTFHVYKNGDHQISLNAKSDNNRAAYIEADNSYSILTSPAVGNGVRALRVDTNDIATALNGTIDATDTSQTLPDLTGATMYIGDDSNGGNSIDGHIKRVAIFSEALSDTELQALTS